MIDQYITPPLVHMWVQWLSHVVAAWLGYVENKSPSSHVYPISSWWYSVFPDMLGLVALC
jgi:hypothetical protein